MASLSRWPVSVGLAEELSHTGPGWSSWCWTSPSAQDPSRSEVGRVTIDGKQKWMNLPPEVYTTSATKNKINYSPPLFIFYIKKGICCTSLRVLLSVSTFQFLKMTVRFKICCPPYHHVQLEGVVELQGRHVVGLLEVVHHQQLPVLETTCTLQELLQTLLDTHRPRERPGF